MNVRTLTTMVLCALPGGVLIAAPAALAAGPPVVEETSVVDVAGTSATFKATINPAGNETTYRFEYGTTEAYGSAIPTQDGLVGSGTGGIVVTAHPQDLLSSTEYHYRVVAIVASRSETVPGDEGTFTTQTAGSEFALPDGRQWELVSPPDKYGATIYSLNGKGGIVGPLQAAENGSGIAYLTNVPTELEPPGYAQQAGSLQVLSTRGAQGWSTRDISTPRDAPTRLQGEPEYELFSKDLSLAVATPLSEEHTLLLSNQASEPTPYIRRETLCDSPASASECYLPLVTGKEGFADVPPGTKFGERYAVTVEDASPELNHVLLQSNVALAKTPTTKGEVYEWSAGAPTAEALQLISVLPASEGGGPTEAGTAIVGSIDRGDRHSVSDDGSRIFWTESLPEGTTLYMRDTVKGETGETIRLDVRQPGAPGGGEPNAVFQSASSDGSRVFFTDGDVTGRPENDERLTAQSGKQGQDLYECEIVEEAGRLACKLTDLTPEREGHPAEVQNVVTGVSEDGSYVYFVANSVLGTNTNSAGENATQGTCKVQVSPDATCNLYEYHDGTITFIASLSGEDEFDWGRGDSEIPLYHGIANLTARVSPNGRYLAFMSDRSLTGYDNRDAVSGKPDMEVYLYDAQSGGLACVSCNPTGARPVGVEVQEMDEGRSDLVAIRPQIGDGGYTGESWVAANLPAGDEVHYQTALYQPRALSDDGRVFFNSSDALAPQDANGQEDVYEFEPVGIGGCVSSSVTFSQKTGGCVSLISAGTSPEESAFLDASEGGSDVFFMTTSRLTSQDYDTAYDIYDAHECSSAAPCIAPPVSPPPCDTGDSCKAAPSPQPSVFGAPASATFAGAGNVVVGSPPTPVATGRSLTRAQKLARALKACRKESKKRRATCRARARKRFGAGGARKAARAMRKGQG